MTSSQLLLAPCWPPGAGLPQLEDVPPGLDDAALFVLRTSLGLLVPGCGGCGGQLQHCVESDRWLDISVIICLDTTISLGLEKQQELEIGDFNSDTLYSDYWGT